MNKLTLFFVVAACVIAAVYAYPSDTESLDLAEAELPQGERVKRQYGYGGYGGYGRGGYGGYGGYGRGFGGGYGGGYGGRGGYYGGYGGYGGRGFYG